MNNHARWAAALILLPLAACNTNRSNPMDATVPQPIPAATTANAQDQSFAQTAAASDQFEIQSSQLALEKSHSRPVRAYAQRMIDEHTASSQKLAALASRKGMNVSGVLDPTQQQLLSTLQSSNRGFDQAYMRGQATGHTATVSAYQTEISGGSDPEVRGFVQQNLPMVEGHLDEVKRMAGR